MLLLFFSFHRVGEDKVAKSFRNQNKKQKHKATELPTTDNDNDAEKGGQKTKQPKIEISDES